ncbi:hypothetical protein HDV01_003108 [Terramyces sp. JEL0728]|nr:hypothetical protein HDV01_003108 [Terramyces sp. JEL0728]
MGLSISKLFKKPTNAMGILIVGLDRSGKSTILYRYKFQKFIQTDPTLGFNVEIFKYKNTDFTAWDMGVNNYRQLSNHYLSSTQGIVFVVDSNDSDRIEEAKNELHELLDRVGLPNALLLVFVNKQDLPNALGAPEMADRLGLYSLSNREWTIQSSSATTGEGLYAGLKWLSAKHEQRIQNQEK